MRSGMEATLGGSVGEAQKAVDDGVCGLDISGLQPPEVASLVRWTGQVISSLELVRAKGVAALEKVDAHLEAGAGSMVDFLAGECRLTPEAAGERVVFARQLEQLQATVEGVADGKLSFDDAAVVARTTAQARPNDVSTVEAMMLARAGEIGPGLLRAEGRAILGEVDAEALRRSSERARERRALRIGPDIDGLRTISGYLTSMSGTELEAALRPYMTPADRHDTRTAVQRRHDALQQVCRLAVAPQAQDEGATPFRGRRPSVVVVASPSAVAGEAGEAARVEGRAPISQDELDAVLDDADILVATKHADGTIMRGRSARTFSERDRQALLALHPTCVFEGCTRPTVDITVHHLVEFSRGGGTVLGNGAPLCWFHQQRVHWDGWAIVRDPGGGFRTLAPNHPDNPRTGMPPEEYRKRQRAAILGRQMNKGQLQGSSPPAPQLPGPAPP
jgi:hypothetical protein